MFSVLVFAWRYDQPPFAILIFALLNDGSILTISTDRAQGSKSPEKWMFRRLLTTAVVLGLYLTISTLIFFHVVYETEFFDRFNVERPWALSRDPNDSRLHSLVYLQVSISGQLMIFSTRSQLFWFSSRPSLWPILAFIAAQTVATFIAVYADWGFTGMQGIGWRWAVIAWVWSLVWFVPMDIPKLAVRALWSGKAWATAFKIRRAFRASPNLHLRASKHRLHVDPTSIGAARHRAASISPSQSSAHRMSISDTIGAIERLHVHGKTE